MKPHIPLSVGLSFSSWLVAWLVRRVGRSVTPPCSYLSTCYLKTGILPNVGVEFLLQFTSPSLGHLLIVFFIFGVTNPLRMEGTVHRKNIYYFLAPSQIRNECNQSYWHTKHHLRMRFTVHSDWNKSKIGCIQFLWAGAKISTLIGERWERREWQKFWQLLYWFRLWLVCDLKKAFDRQSCF